MSEVEILATGLGFPEGPVVCPDGSVILTEIRNNQCSRVAPDGRDGFRRGMVGQWCARAQPQQVAFDAGREVLKECLKGLAVAHVTHCNQQCIQMDDACGFVIHHPRPQK